MAREGHTVSYRLQLDTPHAFVFSEIVVCLDCGFTSFTVAGDDALKVDCDLSSKFGCCGGMT